MKPIDDDELNRRINEIVARTEFVRAVVQRIILLLVYVVSLALVLYWPGVLR